MLYRVTACSPEESAKADRDPSYSPVEYTIDHFEANNDTQAQRRFAKRIKVGTYPKGAALVRIT